MGTLYYLIYIGICAVAIMDILKGTLPNDKRVIWILVVVFIPVLGAILYYFLGRK
jgi:hypothetical protein